MVSFSALNTFVPFRSFSSIAFPSAAAEIPEGLDVATREDEKYKYLFVQNYGAEPAAFPMDTETYQPMTGEYDGVVRRFETVVFRKEK